MNDPAHHTGSDKHTHTEASSHRTHKTETEKLSSLQITSVMWLLTYLTFVSTSVRLITDSGGGENTVKDKKHKGDL